jgi:hypothetical protein
VRVGTLALGSVALFVPTPAAVVHKALLALAAVAILCGTVTIRVMGARGSDVLLPCWTICILTPLTTECAAECVWLRLVWFAVPVRAITTVRFRRMCYFGIATIACVSWCKDTRFNQA